MKIPITYLAGPIVVLFLLVIVAQGGLFSSPSEPAFPAPSAGDARPRRPGFLPWEGEPRFEQAVIANDAPFLLAAYHISLPQPTPGELHNVQLAAQKLAGTVVAPAAVFSQNQSLGPYTSENGFQEGPILKGTQTVNSTGGGVCKIASLLYNLAVMSNLPVLERHCHSLTVPYVPPGQDATVFYGVKDLRFKNNTDNPLLIWAATLDNSLYLAFYGNSIPPPVSWRHEVSRRVEYWTIYRRNSALPPGVEQVVIPGQDGCFVRSWAIVEGPDGPETVVLGDSWYNALPQVVEQGP